MTILQTLIPRKLLNTKILHQGKGEGGYPLPESNHMTERHLPTIPLHILNRGQSPKQSIRLLIRSGSEEQRRRRPGTRIVAKRNRPQAIDVNRIVVRILQLPVEAAGDRVEGQNLTAAELSDQHIMAMRAKVTRCQRKSPGSIEPRPSLQPVQQPSMRREDVDKAQPGAGLLIVLAGPLLREGNIQITSDVLNVERRKPFRQPLILKAVLLLVYRLEAGIEDLHLPLAKIRDIEKTLRPIRGLGSGDRRALEHRILLIHHDYSLRGLHPRVPTRDRPLFRHE